MGAVASLIVTVTGINRLVPTSTLAEQLSAFLKEIDFHRMKRADMPEDLQATVAGESLFNDGVGVVV